MLGSDRLNTLPEVWKGCNSTKLDDHDESRVQECMVVELADGRQRRQEERMGREQAQEQRQQAQEQREQTQERHEELREERRW